ncbi:hypothetical protein [Dictyobacter kobayashii]|uniref:Uncharacterized protein n=1 Tax=Dictyobacter kobayashii TaxID=2014872 RepID=A0A402AJT0_9CHLR|nr:hypothetical protein [Dictyobacter kobayashii]GCE19362.1 hypothetical protein KDK_31620 [Dictyobacter kobayashii]
MQSMAWLLKFYPRQWRERYEVEMLDLLNQQQNTFFTGIDLLFGALDAHLNPHYLTERMLISMEHIRRIRTANNTIFWAFPVFLFCWFSLILPGINVPWEVRNASTPLVQTIQIVGAVMVSLALLLLFGTGLFIGFFPGRSQANTPADEKVNLLALSCSILALLLYIAFTILRPHIIIAYNYINLTPLALVPIALAVVKSKGSEHMLRLARVPVTLITLCMVLQVLTGIVCLLALTILWHGSGPAPKFLIGFILMAILTGIVVWNFLRSRPFVLATAGNS